MAVGSLPIELYAYAPAFAIIFVSHFLSMPTKVPVERWLLPDVAAQDAALPQPMPQGSLGKINQQIC
jgi:hypothetical protein